MHLSRLFCARPEPADLPGFVRAVDDVGGVRILRLQGDVGKQIGGEVTALREAESKDPAPFSRSLLLDFAGASGCDFATVSYLVQALSVRLERGSRVALLHPPPALLAELEIARLQGLFGLYDDEEEALRGLAG